MSGGEAHALTAPQYAIRGKTTHDQEWIDETIEAGVAGLGWKRPKPRPAEWDNATPPKPAPAAKKKFNWKIFSHGES